MEKLCTGFHVTNSIGMVGNGGLVLRSSCDDYG